jgi:drug/metabolite transporter (DMT)-like permease
VTLLGESFRAFQGVGIALILGGVTLAGTAAPARPTRAAARP